MIKHIFFPYIERFLILIHKIYFYGKIRKGILEIKNKILQELPSWRSVTSFHSYPKYQNKSAVLTMKIQIRLVLRNSLISVCIVCNSVISELKNNSLVGNIEMILIKYFMQPNRNGLIIHLTHTLSNNIC